MKLLKSHPLFSLLNSYLIDSPQPVNISYLWNFGSLLGVCLVIQIITCKSTTDLSHLLSTLDNLDLRESLSAPKDKGPCHHNLSLTGPLFLLNNKWCNLIKKVFSGSREYLNSFQFIKGLNHGLTLPTLPLKVEKYHKSFFGKIIRVSGGISAYILLTSSSEFSLFDKESLEPFFYLIASLGLYHLIYMSTIFSLRFLYVMYHIISGNWIHRNSPLK